MEIKTKFNVGDKVYFVTEYYTSKEVIWDGNENYSGKCDIKDGVVYIIEMISKWHVEHTQITNIIIKLYEKSIITEYESLDYWGDESCVFLTEEEAIAKCNELNGSVV